jgi:hypothetical protein
VQIQAGRWAGASGTGRLAELGYFQVGASNSGGDYSAPLTLYAAQSPYLVDTATTLASDLIIEPGVRLVLDSANLVVKGKVTSVGTSSSRITIESTTTGGMCMGLPLLDNSQGAPGSSLLTRIEKTDFKYATAKFNGGSVKDNTIMSTGCSMDGASFIKAGSDPLRIENVTTTNFGSITILGDARGTIVKNLSGSMLGQIKVTSGALETTLDTVTLSKNFSSGGQVMEINRPVSINDLTLTLTGQKVRAIAVGAASDIELGDVTISGAGCGSAIGTGNFNVTLRDATITCDQLVNSNGSGSGKITLDHIDATVSDAVFYALGSQSMNVELTNSNLTCANNSEMCDLFYKANFNTGDVATVAINDNNISCQGDSSTGCRGIVMYYQYGDTRSTTLNLDLDNNFWSNMSKTLPAGIASSIVEDSTSNEATASHASEIRIFEFGTQGNMNITYSIAPYVNASTQLAGKGRR